MKKSVFVKPVIAMLIVVAAVSGCSKKRKAPETYTGSAEVGKACVEKAASAYNVSLSYITLDPLTADPTKGYSYAYQGLASQSSGAETTFLCRLDENKNFVDLVTYIPKK